MSRQREQIEMALRSKGYTPTHVEWEPIGAGAEKCGPSGGWFVFFEPCAPVKGLVGGENIVLGYNIAEVLNDIRRLPPRSRRGHE